MGFVPFASPGGRRSSGTNGVDRSQGSWAPAGCSPPWEPAVRCGSLIDREEARHELRGARPPTTFRRVILPLALPGLVAGSIFTFSLTLGDFIIPTIIGNSSCFIGAVVYVQQATAGNLPLAAAFSVVPVAIMDLYLIIARRLGAFEAP